MQLCPAMAAAVQMMQLAPAMELVMELAPAIAAVMQHALVMEVVMQVAPAMAAAVQVMQLAPAMAAAVQVMQLASVMGDAVQVMQVAPAMGAGVQVMQLAPAMGAGHLWNLCEEKHSAADPSNQTKVYHSNSRMARLDRVHVRIRCGNDVDVHMEHIGQTLYCDMVTPGCGPQSVEVPDPTKLLPSIIICNGGNEMIVFISRLHIAS